MLFLVSLLLWDANFFLNIITDRSNSPKAGWGESKILWKSIFLTLLLLFRPTMQHTRGYTRRPTGSGRGSHRSSLAAKSRVPRSPTIPVAVRVGARSSPRIAASASRKVFGGASDDCYQGEDCVDESQPLLSPPARAEAMPYVCDWAQAIVCTYSSLKPITCQRQGCDALVHHLCQAAWEQQEGCGDTIACLCRVHHPDYNDVAGVLNNDLSKAMVVNVESQVTSEDIVDCPNDSADEEDESGGNDSDNLLDNPTWDDLKSSGGEKGGDDVDDNNSNYDNAVLPPYEITDYTADTYDIHERTAHFMARCPISPSNRSAVEAVYMVEALTIVKSMKTMRKTEIAKCLQEKYRAFIRGIPIERFSDRGLQLIMQEKYFRAKGTSAEGLLTKANDVLKHVRVMAAGVKGVGTPLHMIPSGRSLTDMKNEFILKSWHKMRGTIYAPSSNDEILITEVPDGWWLNNPNTHYLLAVLVHRCNPDIVSDPTTVPAGPTREKIRKDTQKETVERRDRDRIVEQYATVRQRAEESMLESKAKLMAQTIDSGTIDQVKEQLALLSQFKDSFVNIQNRTDGDGENKYDETAHDLLSELPFMKKRRMLAATHTCTNLEMSNLDDSHTTTSSTN